MDAGDDRDAPPAGAGAGAGAAGGGGGASAKLMPLQVQVRARPSVHWFVRWFVACVEAAFLSDDERGICARRFFLFFFSRLRTKSDSGGGD